MHMRSLQGLAPLSRFQVVPDIYLDISHGIDLNRETPGT